VPTEYYTHTNEAPTKGKAYSSYINGRFQEVAASFGKIPEPSDLKRGSINFGSTAGAANAYTVTIANIAAYTDFQRATIRFHAANTGASVINVSGIGSVALKRSDGSALQAGDISVNSVLTMVYDDTNSYFVIDASVAALGTYLTSVMAIASTVSSDASSVSDDLEAVQAILVLAQEVVVAAALVSHTDVAIDGALTAGQALVYDAATSKFRNSTVSSSYATYDKFGLI
jgi:hypothetical protein